ncbi:MAG: DUF6094 domain-containing protein [Acidobacteriota bacterium]|jgi:Uncharacterised methyltransferase family (DUF6094)
MARLASQMKMGFYPTPVEVVQQIKNMLHIAPGARLIDTCCGEGEALGMIAEGAGAITYGVELDRERFKAARDTLDHVLWADAVHEFVCSKGVFGLLWLNPPYDTTEGAYEQEKTRLELEFLSDHWRYLQERGVLVYIVPFMILSKVIGFLERRCRDLAILSFPDRYFWTFRQVVVICTKGRAKREEALRNREVFQAAIGIGENLAPAKLPTTANAGLKYEVPAAGKDDDFVFRSFRLDPDVALEKVKQSPVWGKVNNQVFPAIGNTDIRPLTPLREGHLAMLLASGMMNGEVIGENGQRLIVKGSVRKDSVKTKVETEDTVKHIETDRYKITVRAICFDPLEIITIQ